MVALLRLAWSSWDTENLLWDRSWASGWSVYCFSYIGAFLQAFFSKVGAGESQQENETYMHRYHRMRKDKQGVFLGVLVLYLVQDRSGKCLLLG